MPENESNMFDDIAIRTKLITQLTSCITMKREIGRKLAQAEHDYKKARTLLMHKMMLDGYEQNGKKTKPIAATAVYNMAQGDPEVAKLKLERDIRQADLDVYQEQIYSLKLQINILEKDIENDRKNP